jgi:hypothetical protein
MAQSPNNSVVLRCSDGFRRCCIMASALLLQLGGSLQPMNEDEPHITALKFYYLKRGHPQAKDQLLTPSQIRFIKFFSDCLNAGIVTPMVSTHVIFASFLFTTLQGVSRQAARLCIDSVSLDVPFSCDDLIVRVISDGLTWDSSSSSRISVDSNGSCVCPVNFSVVDDVIVAIYSSTFVKPVASLAFHTLVSYCISLSPCCYFLTLGSSFSRPSPTPWCCSSTSWTCTLFSPTRRRPFRFNRFLSCVIPFISAQVRVVTSPSVAQPAMPVSAGQSPYASFAAPIITTAATIGSYEAGVYDA